MKLPLVTITFIALALVSAQDQQASGVRGGGVGRNSSGQVAEIKVRFANVKREEKVLVFGELEFATTNRTTKTRYAVRVSPRDNRKPVRGTLSINGNTATFEGAGSLLVSVNGRQERIEGVVRAQLIDRGETNDAFAITFTKNGRTESFEGKLDKGNITVQGPQA